MTDRITDAIECFHQLDSELAEETNTHGEQVKWVVGERWNNHACSVHDRSPSDFKQRCAQKLEHLGDIAVDVQQHDEAITQYSTALSLNPIIPPDTFVKQPLLRKWAGLKLTGGSWRDALVAALDVSISFYSGVFAGLTLRSSGVYSPEIHDLLHSVRPSRNDQPYNGRNRVFPPNEQRIGGGDEHAWRAGEMGRRRAL